MYPSDWFTFGWSSFPMQNKDERDCKYGLTVLTDTYFFSPHHPTSGGFKISVTKAIWNALLCCITFIPLKKRKAFHNTARVAANASTKEAAGMCGLVVETIMNLHTAWGQGHCTVTPGILCKQRSAWLAFGKPWFIICQTLLCPDVRLLLAPPRTHQSGVNHKKCKSSLHLPISVQITVGYINLFTSVTQPGGNYSFWAFYGSFLSQFFCSVLFNWMNEKMQVFEADMSEVSYGSLLFSR